MTCRAHIECCSDMHGGSSDDLVVKVKLDKWDNYLNGKGVHREVKSE